MKPSTPVPRLRHLVVATAVVLNCVTLSDGRAAVSRASAAPARTGTVPTVAVPTVAVQGRALKGGGAPVRLGLAVVLGVLVSLAGGVCVLTGRRTHRGGYLR